MDTERRDILKTFVGNRKLQKRLPGLSASQDKKMSSVFFSTWRRIQFAGDLRVDSGEMALASLKDWHERVGHNNLEDGKRLQQQVDGMQITSSERHSSRECLLNKSKREAVSKEVSTMAQQKLEIVHAVVLGPINLVAVNGHKYAI